MFIVYFTIRLLRLLEWLVIFRVLASWFPQVQASKIGQLLYTLTEPILAPCRNLLFRFHSLRTLPVDFSPIVVFLIIGFVQRLLYSMMYTMY